MKAPWRTLRGRLALGSILGLIVASLAFAALGTELIRSQSVADSIKDLETQTAAIAKLMSDDAQRAFQGPDAGYDPSPAYIRSLEAIVGKDTRLVYQGPDVNPDPTAPQDNLERIVLGKLDKTQLDGVQRFDATLPNSSDRAIAAAAPITLSDGSVFGWAILLRKQDTVLSVWRQFAKRLVLAAGVGLLFAFLLSLVLTRRALRPLQRMELAAISVGKGDLDTRVVGDTTEEFNAMATAFNTMVRELQHREALTRDFLMRVTHDLRTPLTAIRGHSQALADGVVPSESIPRSLGAIDDEAGRLEALITDLLDLAKLEARRFRLDLETVDGTDLIERAFNAYEGEAARRGVRYERDVQPLPPLYTDGARVRQIVGNLIDNAFRWTPDGGAILVAAHPRPGGGAVVSVADTGPGIAPDQLTAIFEPFRSENTPDGQHGSGLGLAISRNLARALGGDLRVESRLGRGSRFILDLPGESHPQSQAQATARTQ